MVCRKSEDEHETNGHEYRPDESIPRWQGWYSARRKLESILYQLGVPDKVIQEILRHANCATTMTYYVKPTSKNAQEGMAQLAKEF